MSGLWDYDDDAPPPQTWEAPPPPEPPSPEPLSSDEDKPTGKGRGRGKRGRSAKEKPAIPSKGRGRGKRGQAAITLEALASPPKAARTAEYIPDSDDDDVVLVLPGAYSMGAWDVGTMVLVGWVLKKGRGMVAPRCCTTCQHVC